MKYQAPFNNGGNPDAGWINGNPSTGTEGSIPSAAAFEQPLRELDALIAKSGVTPSDADLTQIAQAIRSQALNYRVAGGTANALTVTLDPAPAALVVGLPLRIKVATTNTGPATLKVGSLSAGPIVRADGTALQAGDLQAGQVVTVAYDGASWQVIGLTSAVAPKRRLIAYTTAGTYSWACPAGVTLVDAEVVGGGCSGGRGVSDAAAGGGGSGAYSRGFFDVVPGQTYTIVVGAGGASQTGAGVGGLAGGASSFGAFCTAPGAPSVFTILATGSKGGDPGVGGQINYSGSPGGDGTASNLLGGFGGAGPFGGGGRPGVTGVSGISPGSGGGGSYGTAPGPSGAGAAGAVIIRY